MAPPGAYKYKYKLFSLKLIYNHSIPLCPIFYILILNDNFNIRTLRN